MIKWYVMLCSTKYTDFRFNSSSIKSCYVINITGVHSFIATIPNIPVYKKKKWSDYIGLI